MLMFILVCIGLGILICFGIKRGTYLKKLSTIPSLPAVPLIGHTYLLLGGPKYFQKILDHIKRDYQRISIIWFGMKPYILIYNAGDMEKVLRNSKDMPKGNAYDYVKPWLGDSILISEGEKFRQNKKILVQTFHKNNLLDFLPIFNSNAKDLVARLSHHVGMGEFKADKYLAVGAMANLLGTTLGIHKELLTEEEAFSYSESVERLGAFVYERHLKFWLSSDYIFQFSELKRKQDYYLNILNTLTDKVIREKRAEYDQKIANHEVKGDEKESVIFLDNFFSATKANGEKFTEKEIKDEVMTMMFGGQDTTTVTLGFTLSLLGIHQDVQDKVLEEINEIFGDSNREVVYEDTQKMKYLEQVIQESWRLYPPINAFSRTPIKDIQLGDCILPKGTTVICSLFMLHRNEEYYPNSYKFNPGNFDSDRVKERPPYSYIPFSQGYRKCIGSKYAMLVVKVFLAVLLKEYKVICHQQQKQFKLALQLTSRRKEGFLISLERRK